MQQLKTQISFNKENEAEYKVQSGVQINYRSMGNLSICCLMVALLLFALLYVCLLQE